MSDGPAAGGGGAQCGGPPGGAEDRERDLLDELVTPFVFRVARREPRRALLGAVLFSILAAFVSTLPVAILLDVLHAGQSARARAIGWMLAGCVGVGIAAGLRALRLRVSCSDPACDGVPGADDARCPGCGKAIAGTIAHPDDRLAAADAVRRGAYWTGAQDRGITGLRR